MPGQSASPVPRVRNSEDKLYQACLDACIQGIENIAVNRRSSATPAPNNNTATHLDHNNSSTSTNNSIVERASIETISIEPAGSLLSPPPSPQRRRTVTMDYSRWHGAPPAAPRGMLPQGPSGPPSRGSLGTIPQNPQMASGDARANLAIKPAENAGNFKLKKNAVKIVGAAGPAPATPSRPVAPTPGPQVASSPAPGSVKAQPKAAEGPAPATPTPAPKTASSQKENVKSNDTESAMASLFASLEQENTATSPQTKKVTAQAGPDKSMFSFDNGPGTWEVKKEPATRSDNRQRNTQETPREAAFYSRPTKSGTGSAFGQSFDKVKEEEEEAEKKIKLVSGAKAELTRANKAKAGKAAEAGERVDMSHEDLEDEYMRRAGEYVAALPDSVGNTALLFKIVSEKLRSTFVPDIKLDYENNEIIKARFALAIANYLKQNSKEGLEYHTPESVRQMLKDVDGDFLRLCARLVDEKYISLKTLDEITGLVNNILQSLPKAEPAIAAIAKGAKPVAKETKFIVKDTKLVSNDPVDNMTAWPTQTKRENPAAHRTCILKGVAGITSINELQALVWGGKLESIVLPEANSSNALVKFLTPAACEKYHKDTANGIEMVRKTKKSLVFVEKAEGPNSINDLIQNCIDGEASRCIRAIGADEDNDVVLMKMARGKDKIKREVDRIKQGKTARGHPYVEFRFGNIYNALNFKRELMENEAWEHCTISYAPDPCELAKGVHYNDEDEEPKRLGFM